MEKGVLNGYSSTNAGAGAGLEYNSQKKAFAAIQTALSASGPCQRLGGARSKDCATVADRMGGPSKPPSLKVRFLPDFQYLLEPASGVWLLGCGVLTSREA